jgi:hypothetical protein
MRQAEKWFEVSGVSIFHYFCSVKILFDQMIAGLKHLKKLRVIIWLITNDQKYEVQ